MKSASSSFFEYITIKFASNVASDINSLKKPYFTVFSRGYYSFIIIIINIAINNNSNIASNFNNNIDTIINNVNKININKDSNSIIDVIIASVKSTIA